MNRMRFGMLIVVLAMIGVSPSVEAGGGIVGLFADAQGLDCNVRDDAPGLLEVYVIHFALEGVTGIEFSAPQPACMTGAIYLSDTVPFFEVGNSQTGASLGYGGCYSQVGVMIINYFGNGLSEPCCVYPVLPHPDYGLNGSDCAYNVDPALGVSAVVNPDPTCECQTTIPVEESTWSKIKAMYAR